MLSRIFQHQKEDTPTTNRPTTRHSSDGAVGSPFPSPSPSQQQQHSPRDDRFRKFLKKWNPFDMINSRTEEDLFDDMPIYENGDHHVERKTGDGGKENEEEDGFLFVNHSDVPEDIITYLHLEYEKEDKLSKAENKSYTVDIEEEGYYQVMIHNLNLISFEASVRCGSFFDSASKIKSDSVWTSQFYIHGGKVPTKLHVDLRSHAVLRISPCFFSFRLYSRYEEVSRINGELFKGDLKDIEIDLNSLGIYKLFCLNTSSITGQRLRVKVSSEMFSVSSRILDKRQSITSPSFAVFQDQLPAKLHVHLTPDLAFKFSKLTQYTLITVKIINSDSDIAKCQEFGEFGDRLANAIEKRDADLIRILIDEAREKNIPRFKNKHLRVDLHKWLSTAVHIKQDVDHYEDRLKRELERGDINSIKDVLERCRNMFAMSSELHSLVEQCDQLLASQTHRTKVIEALENAVGRTGPEEQAHVESPDDQFDDEEQLDTTLAKEKRLEAEIKKCFSSIEIKFDERICQNVKKLRHHIAALEKQKSLISTLNGLIASQNLHSLSYFLSKHQTSLPYSVYLSAYQDLQGLIAENQKRDAELQRKASDQQIRRDKKKRRSKEFQQRAELECESIVHQQEEKEEEKEQVDEELSPKSIKKSPSEQKDGQQEKRRAEEQQTEESKEEGQLLRPQEESQTTDDQQSKPASSLQLVLSGAPVMKVDLAEQKQNLVSTMQSRGRRHTVATTPRLQSQSKRPEYPQPPQFKVIEVVESISKDTDGPDLDTVDTESDQNLDPKDVLRSIHKSTLELMRLVQANAVIDDNGQIVVMNESSNTTLTGNIVRMLVRILTLDRVQQRTAFFTGQRTAIDVVKKSCKDGELLVKDFYTLPLLKMLSKEKAVRDYQTTVLFVQFALHRNICVNLFQDLILNRQQFLAGYYTEKSLLRNRALRTELLSVFDLLRQLRFNFGLEKAPQGTLGTKAMPMITKQHLQQDAPEMFSLTSSTNDMDSNRNGDSIHQLGQRLRSKSFSHMLPVPNESSQTLNHNRKISGDLTPVDISAPLIHNISTLPSSDASKMTEMTLKELTRAVRSVVEQFSNHRDGASPHDIGTESYNPEIGIIIRKKLCPVLRTILNQGLIVEHYHVWDIIAQTVEHAAQQDQSRVQELTSMKTHVDNFISGQNKIVGSAMNNEKDLRFVYFIVMAVNSRLLLQFMTHLLRHRDLLHTAYSANESILRHSETMALVCRRLHQLSKLPIKLIV